MNIFSSYNPFCSQATSMAASAVGTTKEEVLDPQKPAERRTADEDGAAEEERSHGDLEQWSQIIKEETQNDENDGCGNGGYIEMDEPVTVKIEPIDQCEERTSMAESIPIMNELHVQNTFKTEPLEYCGEGTSDIYEPGDIKNETMGDDGGVITNRDTEMSVPELQYNTNQETDQSGYETISDHDAVQLEERRNRSDSTKRQGLVRGKSYTSKSVQQRYAHLKRYKCTICEKVFYDKCKFNQHTIIHTGERSYSCEVCGKSFRQKRNLNGHKILCTGEMPYSCNHCGKSFVLKSDLQKHETSHTHSKQFACKMCGKLFPHPVALVLHSTTAHPQHQKYPCEICGEAFGEQRLINQHFYLVHTTGPKQGSTSMGYTSKNS